MATTIPELYPVSKVSKIHVPLLLPDSTHLQGFAFSHRLLMTKSKKAFPVPKDSAGLKKFKQLVKQARELAKQSDGGPGVGKNYISIKISNNHDNAASQTDHLVLYFNSDRKFLRLHGFHSGVSFPKGRWLTWDMGAEATDPENWIETVPTDAWDNLVLANPSGDGILIENIKVVHSDFVLVDWPLPGEEVWLDGSLGERFGMIGLADQILQSKLAALDVGVRRIAQLHWAVTELGKSDGTKYGCTGAWCSEFVSWCLRKSGFWDAPTVAPEDFDSDGIGSGTMNRYFNGLGRSKTKADLTSGAYYMTAGDYVRFNNHSAMFVRYVNDSKALSDVNKSFVTIDGNIGARVCINTRKVNEIVNVGSTI
ncbi:MAG: hypothetical protein KDI47_12380 [Gammaproteobacteria bacterium]|nr:hypothetical protein [Gammaproteobacteria bacterium]MCB1862504.1 hypothetical protein [Gammaproteobacteria bacterium]MCB1903706.1 hypothetical protein [Gammaproteobacteria bacterium]